MWAPFIAVYVFLLRVFVFLCSVPALRRYMDPAYTDELGLSDEAKAELILAGQSWGHLCFDTFSSYTDGQRGGDTQTQKSERHFRPLGIFLKHTHVHVCACMCVCVCVCVHPFV